MANTEVTDDATVQPTVQDLINTCIGEKPDEFANKFNELMRTRLSTAVDAKKTELSAAIFGTPEGQTDVADTIAQAHAETDDDETPVDEPTETEETE